MRRGYYRSKATSPRNPEAAQFENIVKPIQAATSARPGARTFVQTAGTCWMERKRPITKTETGNSKSVTNTGARSDRKLFGQGTEPRCGVGRIVQKATQAPGSNIGTTGKSGSNRIGILSHPPEILNARLLASSPMAQRITGIKTALPLPHSISPTEPSQARRLLPSLNSQPQRNLNGQKAYHGVHVDT